MTEVKISDKTELTVYDEYVNIYRSSRKGERSVNVPLSVINWAVANKDLIEDLKPGLRKPASIETLTPPWRIIKSVFRSKIYTGFSQYSDLGVRNG